MPFGLLILHIAPELDSAAVLTSFIYTFIVSFSDIVQPVNLMPGFWRFMNKGSLYTYFIQNLIAAFLNGRKVHYSDAELVYFNRHTIKRVGSLPETLLKPEEVIYKTHKLLRSVGIVNTL